MKIKVIITIFVIAQIVFLYEVTIADIGKGPLEPVKKIDLTNPRLNDLTDARPVQPSFKKPSSAIDYLTPSEMTNLPSPPLEYFCDAQSFGGIEVSWTIPDAYGDNYFNTRFTSEEGFECTLKVAHFMMYAPKTVGDPDFRAYLWNDDGFGFPGVKLDSIDILDADIDTAANSTNSNFYWLTADFSSGNWVFSDGEEYHIGWTIIDNSGSGTDVLVIVSDDGSGESSGEERSSEFYGGMWGSMLNDYGNDFAFYIISEQCNSEIPQSSCYSYSAIENLGYFWRAPNTFNGVVAYSQRFNIASYDTLVSVDFAIYDDFVFHNGIDSVGNNTIFMTIWGDDGVGLPDPKNLISQVAFPPYSYGFYPALATATFDLELTPGDYHTSFSTDGIAGVSYESCISSDGTDGVMGSSSEWGGGGQWESMLEGWGLDVNFYFVVNVCINQNTICLTKNPAENLAYFWRLPDTFGDTHNAQKVTVNGRNCQVKEISWSLYETATPGLYQHDAVVELYSDVGGLPGGAPVASLIINPDDYILYPGKTTVDFSSLEVYFPTDFWVSITSLSPALDTTQGIRVLSDLGGSGLDRESAEMWNGTWANMCDGWGVTCDLAFLVETKMCCNPYGTQNCFAVGEIGWATLQGDQGRTGVSSLSVGDSWCNLNLNWAYEDPTSGVSFCGPTVYDGQVLCTFNNKVINFDLATGAVNYVFSPGGTLTGSSMRTTPTIADVGHPNGPLVYIGGGVDRSFLAFELNTGNLVWDYGVPIIGDFLIGTRWGTSVVLELESGPVVIWSTDDGDVQAADALTGSTVWGPVNLGMSTYKSGATDGTSLFYGTHGGGSAEGDLYSLDAESGNINWQLSATDGLQGTVEFGGAYTGGDEGFHGCSYREGVVYANSRLEGDYPVDGLMYRVDANTGALIGNATMSNRVRYASPILDLNYIFMPTHSRWATPPAGSHILAFNRASGAVAFSMQSQSGGGYYVDGLLTCEQDNFEADQLFAFNEDGFLSSFNTEDGSEIWRRRIFNSPGYAPNIGMAGAIVEDDAGDVHVLFSTFWGNLFDLTKGEDRSRLQFESYNLQASVEFGAAASLDVDFGPFITNTGCTDLVLSDVFVALSAFTPDIPSFSAPVEGDLLQRASSIANDLTSRNTDKLASFARSNDLSVNNDLVVRNYEKNLSNPLATDHLVFINGVNTPFTGQVIAPGEVVNLNIDVIQSQIVRGPQSFYIELKSNDPDFFLNNPTLAPQAFATIVGGCLVDTTTMEFGVGGANIQLVTNTARLGTGDWSPHGFEIDGDATSYYQGAYVHSVSKYRLATNVQDWRSGGGEEDAFYSMQPDLNYCDNSCKPALSTGVPLGDITLDGGASYVSITGNMVCTSYLDSVKNFDLGDGWNWENYSAPFDNDSTMGLFTNQRTIGALDLPALANLTLSIMEITERNGQVVNGWYLSSINDYDVGGDLGAIDIANSVAWSFEPGRDGAWGQIKIPFGQCDGEPLINAHGLNGPASLWDWSPYWDSAFMWNTSGEGYFDHDMQDGDGVVHITLAQHDFLPNETITIGIVNFGVTGLNDNSSGAELALMAKLVNKWAGFGRGDVNDDGSIGLSDILYLAAFVNAGGNGPIPFMHTGDVNNDGAVDIIDVEYLVNYYFCLDGGACPIGDWVI